MLSPYIEILIAFMSDKYRYNKCIEKNRLYNLVDIGHINRLSFLLFVSSLCSYFFLKAKLCLVT